MAELIPIAEAMEALTEETRQRHTKGEMLLGPSTGLADLDFVLGGLRPGGLIVIGGRAGVGCSALVHSIAAHVAMSAGAAVALISTSDAPVATSRRLACLVGRLDRRAVETGRLSTADRTALLLATRRLAEAPLDLVVGGRPVGIDELVALLSGGRKDGERHRLIVVDRLASTAGVRHPLGIEALAELRTWAHANAATVLVVVRATAQPSSGFSVPPVAQLPSADVLVDVADTLLLLDRPPVPRLGSLDHGTLRVQAHVNRGGLCGSWRLAFRADTGLVANLAVGVAEDDG